MSAVSDAIWRLVDDPKAIAEWFRSKDGAAVGEQELCPLAVYLKDHGLGPSVLRVGWQGISVEDGLDYISPGGQWMHPFTKWADTIHEGEVADGELDIRHWEKITGDEAADKLESILKEK